jgi:dipeptidyl-peptidase 4
LSTPRWILVILMASLASTATSAAQAEKLTIERIFAAPDLSGASLRSPQISPDGQLVAYLRGAERNKDRMDLWAYDVVHHQHRLLVDAATLVPQEHALSPEEEQRRERQRTSSLSGIVEYQFSPDSRRLLVPLGGDLYLYDLHAKPEKAVRRLTHSGSYETDPKFSPLGHYVSFIRDQNLIVYDLATGQEIPITRNGGGLITFGTAEFIAQEEMSRTTGYWWSPNEKYIAYTRVDESPVPEVERFEIYADTTKVVKQRYPGAGKPNAIVQLFVSQVAPAPGASETPGTATAGAPAPVQVDLGSNTDVYLARVNWFPDSGAIAVQRQSRDQKTLTLLRANPTTGATRELLSEHSDTWVELNDDLAFLQQPRQLIWGSSRTGFTHLYLYDWDGHLIRPLTRGDWLVTGDNDPNGLRGVDRDRGLVYFTANAETPIERHLYSVSFKDPSVPMQKITVGSGWHSITMSDDARLFLDTFSTPDQPPSVTLRSANGTELAPLVPNKLTPDHPYAPYLAEHLPTEFGTLPASDGQTLYYQIVKPRNLVAGHRYPVIVSLYGGPGIQLVRKVWGGSLRSNEGFFRQYLAQNGYIVFTLDNRGSGSRGVKFETPVYHHLGSVEVEDQVAGVNYLKTLPYVDPARIGVFGWSYGGYMSLMCLMQAPDTFAAAVAGAPPTDWRLYDTHYTERYMSTPEDNTAGYEKSSVMQYASNLRGPLLIMHGMADDNVLFTHSTALFKKLQDLRKPFDIMTYPGSKHGLLRHADTGPHGYMTVKAFFDRTIGEKSAGNEARP